MRQYSNWDSGMDVEQRTVKTEDFEWNVLDIDLPEPSYAVVCLHGFMGTAEDWLPLMQRLSEYARCVAVDLPGHGKTRSDLVRMLALYCAGNGSAVECFNVATAGAAGLFDGGTIGDSHSGGNGVPATGTGDRICFAGH